MMHRIFLRRLVPFTFLLYTGCSEPLHVGDIVPTTPIDCNGLWAKKLGGDTNGAGVTHAVDAAGNIFLAGKLLGTIDLGTGPLTSQGAEDVLVAKLTSDGAPIWSKSFGDEKTQQATSIAIDGGGNVIVTGIARGTVDFGGGPRTASEAGEAFLVKLDPSGNHLWSKLLGSGTVTSSDAPNELEVFADANGGILISGFVDGDLDLDGTKQTLPNGSFVTKLDGDGAVVWERSFEDARITARINRKGEVALVGTFNGAFTLGGSSPLLANSPGMRVVAHLDAQGKEIYKLAYGSASLHDRGVIDESGSVTIAGSNLSDPFFLGAALINAEKTYVVKLNPSGLVVYSRTGNNPQFSSARPYALTAIEGDSGESSAYVLGDFHRFDAAPLDTDTSAATNGVPDFAGCPADDGSSTFVVGLDPRGELTSCRLFAQSSYGLTLGLNRLYAPTITDGGSGRLLLSGAFVGNQSLDCATLESAPQSQENLTMTWPGFVAKISR